MNKKFVKNICSLAICAVISQSVIMGAGVEVFTQHYNAGQEFLLNNQYQSAIVEFTKCLKINYLDNSARIGLINSYLASASYQANQAKNYEKAANDFRAAITYLKIYPDGEQDIQNSVGMISSATSNLNQGLNVRSYDTTPSARYKKAEALRATGNLPAAIYEFYKAAENSSLSGNAYEQIADSLKVLGNEKRSVYYYKLASDSKPNDGNLRMKYARTLDKIGNYDEALPEYNNALAKAKGDLEILYSLERIYMKKLAQSPRDAELLANIGAIKQAQGDFDSALDYYGKAEQINPENITTRINVGTLYQQKKQYQKAIQAYDSVLTMYPDNGQAMFYKAQALTEMGDKNNALALYRRVVTIEPQNTEAKAAIGRILKETMSPAEYITYLANNGSAEELYDYAYKLHKENKTEDAISAYKAVISKDSSKVDAYVNLAICYASKDDYNNAVNILNTAKSKFPANNLVLKTLKDVQSDSLSTQLASANKSFEEKDYKKAIQEYMAITPETENSLVGIAACYQELQDYSNAIAYYKKAENINPKNAELPYYIGYLYSEQKDWTQAETYLNKAIKLNPQSEAKALLSYVKQNGALSELNQGIELFEKQNYAEALIKFTSVLKKEANNAYAYYYRALIYDEQKQQKLAINDYVNCLKNTDELPIVNYMLAVDYDGIDNYKEAFKYYKLFTEKYKTDDEYLKYAKSRMEELKPYAG